MSEEEGKPPPTEDNNSGEEQKNDDNKKKDEEKMKTPEEDVKPSDEKKASDDKKASMEEKVPPPAPEDQKKSSHAKKSPKDLKLEMKKKEKKEQIKKELEERKVKRKEEMAKLAKCEGAKTIADEIQFERMGYEIHRHQLLGSGPYSKIYKAKRKKEESEMCVKLIMLDRVPRDYSQHLTTNALKIIRFVGQGGEKKAPLSIYFPKVFDIFMVQTKLFIFTEEFQTLSLHTRLKTKDTITEYDAKKWGKQLAEAIDCLQLSGIAHRNVRPEHLIFDKKYDIKLVGFDRAVIFWNEDSQQVVNQPKMTFNPKEILRFDHLPPQALKEEYDPSAVDVWGWAVIVCLCIHKQNPFDPKSTQTVEEQWNQYSTKFQFTPESKQLLDKCFVSDASTRISSHEILRHKWLGEKEKKKKKT